jgi:hypothetical protein
VTDTITTTGTILLVYLTLVINWPNNGANTPTIIIDVDGVQVGLSDTINNPFTGVSGGLMGFAKNIRATGLTPGVHTITVFGQTSTGSVTILDAELMMIDTAA